MPDIYGNTSFGGGGGMNTDLQLSGLQNMGVGGGGGGGLGDLAGLFKGLKRKPEAQYLRSPQQQPQAPAYAAPYGPQSGFDQAQRYRTFQNAFDSNRTAAQRASSMMGGPQSTAYGDSARQMMALQAAGLPLTELTGMRDLAQAMSSSSAAATTSAGESQRQKERIASGTMPTGR